MESKRTPGPFVRVGYRVLAGPNKNITIAECFPDRGDVIYKPESDLECIANAQFIVRACNVHDELVAALEKVIGYAAPGAAILAAHAPTEQADRIKNTASGDIAAARAALAKAKGKSE